MKKIIAKSMVKSRIISSHRLMPKVAPSQSRMRSLYEQICCPVTREPMLCPVSLSCGHTISEEAYNAMIERGLSKCPLGRMPFSTEKPPINYVVQSLTTMILAGLDIHSESLLKDVPRVRVTPEKSEQINELMDQYVSLKNIALRTGKREEGMLPIVNKLLALEPNNVSYYYQRCRFYRESGDLQAALQDINHCLSYNTKERPTYMLVSAKILFKMGLEALALKRLNHIIKTTDSKKTEREATAFKNRIRMAMRSEL